MKCCVLTKIALSLMILANAVSCSDTDKAEKVINHQGSQDTSTTLNAEEEAALSELLDNTLSWIRVWAPGPFNFLQGREVVAYHMPAVFKQQEGHEVEMRLVITNAKLTVYMAQLHVRLNFIRLRELGLSPPSIIFFGEDSNDNRLVAEQQEAQQSKLQERELRAFPEPSESLRKELEKKAAGLPANGEQKIEERVYKVPVLSERHSSPNEPWDAERDGLYKQIVSIVDDQVKRYYCRRGLKVHVTIPYFNLGDPEIYILITFPGKAKRFIEWVGFTQDITTGQFSTYGTKQIRRSDELQYWSTPIENNKYTERDIVCE